MRGSIRMSSLPALWNSPNGIRIPVAFSDISQIQPYILALNNNEIQKVEKAFSIEAFDMGVEYVWRRTISLLRDKVLSFGNDFVLEMLGRSSEDIETNDFINEVEVISLASDLGFINKTARMEFLHHNEEIQHFASKYARDHNEEMDITTAQKCIKNCVKYVLGLNDEVFQISFTNFREKLKQSSFKDDGLLESLTNSPYFYKRTTVRALLSLVKSAKGGELDNLLANMNLIVPAIWEELLTEDRYPIGFAYAGAVSEGQTNLVKAFKSLLLKVRGFDYVPENLRSNTFIKAAEKLLHAHNGIDNFYNEPKPAKYLLSLGTSIPGPAVGKCMTAVLACKLGNAYGQSRDAQAYLDEILNGISADRWEYYLNSVLQGDREILYKLQQDRPLKRWFQLIDQYKLEERNCSNPQIIKMIKAAKEDNGQIVNRIAQKMYQPLVL